MNSVASDGRNREPEKTHAWRQTAWITLILLAAAVLRLVNLADAPSGMAIPPGMTHDEADHGLTAWEIVNGARDIYFTVGYGREPLYDYATALVMAGTGPILLAARLTSVYFSLILIAAVYAWACRAFGRPVGLLAAAGLAAGFWPLMAGRQALRSITLPAVYALAALFFWVGVQRRKGEGEKGRRGERARSSSPLPPFPLSPFPPFILAGVFLGLTYYTYIPARAMWLAFPALVGYMLLAPSERRNGRRLLAGLGVTLAVAALVAAPLYFHLANNPGLEVRIEELSAPLLIAADGNPVPLLFNARGALRLFTIEGDQTWRYNIPGKPFLGPVMGALFYVGLGAAGWAVVRGYWRKGEGEKGGKGERERSIPPSPLLPFSPSSSFFALAWIALGFAPVLITGPGLSMTQAIGALPVLYVFPALALAGGYDAIRRAGWGGRHNVVAIGGRLAAIALFGTVGALTVRDYFGRWANEPEVRVQYETTMVTALRYLDQHGRGPASISTITPGRYHTPAVALLTLRNPDVRPRYFDGRRSLLLPAEAGGLLVVPGFTSIPAELQRYLSDAARVDELPMRPDDLDRPVLIYRLNSSGPDVARMTTPLMSDGQATPVDFHNAALLGYDLSAAEVRPGDRLSLVTAWRLAEPLPNASIFAHVAGPVGPLAVGDGLGAPGEAWIAGDTLLQLHTLAIPSDAAAGTYPLVVGVYTQDDGRRLVTGSGDSVATLTTVTVIDE